MFTSFSSTAGLWLSTPLVGAGPQSHSWLICNGHEGQGMIANQVSGAFRVTTEFYKMAEVMGIFVLSNLAIFDRKEKKKHFSYVGGHL